MTARRSSRRSSASALPSSPRVRSQEEQRFLVLIAAIALVRVACALLCGGNADLWSLSYPALLGQGGILVILLLPLAAPVFRSERIFPSPSLLLVLLLLVAGFAGLWQPVTFPLLGDGALYASEILRILNNPDTADALVKPSSWLTGWVVTAMTHLWKPEQVLLPYRVLGTLGWALALVGGWGILRRSRNGEGMFLAVLLCCSPALVFFFGYVELYVLSTVLVALFLLALWGMLYEEHSPWLAGGLLLGAVLCGMAALVFLPMFLGALLIRRGWLPVRFPARVVGGMAALIGVAVMLGHLVHTGSTLHPWLIPVSETGIQDGARWEGLVRYTLFSPDHLFDIVHVLMLMALPAIALMVLLRPRREALADPAVILGVVGALSALALLVLGQTSFGWARDWDLATIPSSAFAFLAAALVRWRGGKDMERALMPGVVLLGLSVAVPWVLMVKDAPATAAFLSGQLDRLEGKVFPQANANGYENLRKFYQVAKMDSARDAVLDRMLRNGYQRETTIAEMLNRMRGLPPGALRQERIHALLTGLKSVPTADPTRRFDHVSDHVKLEAVAEALFLLLDEGAIGEARTWWESFSPSFAETRDHDVVNLLIGPPRSAMERWATLSVDRVNAIRVPRYLLRASTLRYAAGDPEGALTLLERTLALDSTGFPAAYLAAAKIQFESRQNPNDARALLQRCIRLCPTAPEARTAESILTRLSRE